MLHFPIPLARNKDPKAILIGCAACTIILVYTLLAARKRLLLMRTYSVALSKMNLQTLLSCDFYLSNQ